MTKEEAKLVLDNARPQTKEIDRQFYDDEDLNNALDMAIKALEQQSEDCVSRASVKELFQEGCVMGMYDFLGIDDLPPATPTHGTCKDCKHNYKTSRNTFECSNGHRFYMRIPDTFYCADYEKRGSENDI